MNHTMQAMNDMERLDRVNDDFQNTPNKSINISL